MTSEKIRMIAAIAVSAVTFAGCASGGNYTSDTAAASSAPAAVTETKDSGKSASSQGSGFTVDGTRLLDANGKEFVIRGINHSHTWFKNKDDDALKAIASTGSNCVRLVLANGIQWEKDSLENIEALEKKCYDNKLIAILEVHDGTGSDDPAVLDKIADYWIEMKDALIGKEDSVILNIANEWYGS